MKKLSALNKLNIVALSLLLISAFSYINFQNLEYASAKEAGDVHGTKDRSFLEDVPLLADAKELSSKKGQKNSQVLFETAELPSKVYDYYKNLLTNQKWFIETTNISSTDYLTKYEKEDKNLMVTIARDENSKKTIVSLEYYID